jgi:RimJ/RimL family protein N-acetyltransferase
VAALSSNATSDPPAEIPDLASLPFEIRTERLVLRPLRESDVDDLWPHVSDPEVSRKLTWSAHKERAETLEVVRGLIRAREIGTDLVWGIEHEGKVCGFVGLHGIKWTIRAWRVDRAELAYWIGAPLWGKGYMTEAARAVTRWGFDVAQLHKITIGCVEDNLASKRIIEKLGYRFLCRQEEDFWRDGQWWGHLRYEMTRAEYVMCYIS